MYPLIDALRFEQPRTGSVLSHLAAAVSKSVGAQVEIGIPCCPDGDYLAIYGEAGFVKISHISAIGSIEWLTIVDQVYPGQSSLRFTLISADHNSSIDSSIKVLSKAYLNLVLEQTKSKVRSLMIDIKLRTFDIPSYIHKVIDELVLDEIGFQGISIFTHDKLSGYLRLRGTSGLIGAPTFNDQLYNVSSKSWVVRAYTSRRSLFEFNPRGLHKGHSVEETDDPGVSRAYIPILTRITSSAVEHARARRAPCIGAIRLVNVNDGGVPRPFHQLDAVLLEFVAEVVYVNIESLADRDVEGFDRDVAFHAAASVLDGIAKNVDFARALLFGADIGMMYPMARQFELKQSGVFSERSVVRALDNAYAFAQDVLAQVERANLVDRSTSRRSVAASMPIVEHLLSDVLQKALNMMRDIQIWHSAHNVNPEISRLFPKSDNAVRIDLPPPVYGKSGELISVFKNLIDNSVKYREPNKAPKIDITWSRDRDNLYVEVRDYGIGIPSEDVDSLFRPGFRSDRARKYKVRGNGLGLWYSRNLVRTFGGDMTVVAKGKGMSVIVRLKVAQTPARVPNE